MRFIITIKSFKECITMFEDLGFIVVLVPHVVIFKVTVTFKFKLCKVRLCCTGTAVPDTNATGIKAD